MSARKRSRTHYGIRTLSLFASLGLAAVGLAATATTAAAAPPNKPVVTVTVGTLTGPSAPVTYTVNRGAKQVAAVTYSLNGGAPLSADAPTSAGKHSSGGSFTVTAASGVNTVAVTVRLTDGGSVTELAQFTYTASYAKAGCLELFTAGYYTLTDGTNPQLFPQTAGGTTYTYFTDSSCTGTGFAFENSRQKGWVWAGDSAEALSICATIGGNRVVPQREPYLYYCTTA